MGTFGYTSVGNRNDNVDCVGIKNADCLHTSNGTELITRLWIYGRTIEGDCTIDVAVYEIEDGTITNQVCKVTIDLPLDPGWVSGLINNVALENNKTYTIVAGNGGLNKSIYYDQGTSGDGCSAGSMTDPMAAQTNNQWLYPMYAEYSVLQNYTLTATKSTFTLADVSVILKSGRLITCTKNDFTRTGIAALLKVGRKIIPVTAGFTFTFIGVSLHRLYRFTQTVTTFAYTLNDVDLLTHRVSSLLSRSYIFWGWDAGLKVTRKISHEVTNFSLTGSDAEYHYPKYLLMEVGDFAISYGEIGTTSTYQIIVDRGIFTIAFQLIGGRSMNSRSEFIGLGLDLGGTL